MKRSERERGRHHARTHSREEQLTPHRPDNSAVFALFVRENEALKRANRCLLSHTIPIQIRHRGVGGSLLHFIPKTGKTNRASGHPILAGRFLPRFNSFFSVKRRQRYRQRGDPPTGPQRGRRLRDGERALPDRLGQRGAEEAGGNALLSGYFSTLTKRS